MHVECLQIWLKLAPGFAGLVSTTSRARNASQTKSLISSVIQFPKIMKPVNSWESCQLIYIQQ